MVKVLISVASAEEQQKGIFMTVDYDNHKFAVSLNNKYMQQMNLSIACCGLTNEPPYTGVIIVDDNWLACNEEMKSFFIFHEIGHFVNGDLTFNMEHAIDNIHHRESGNTVCDSMEFAADKFSVETISMLENIPDFNKYVANVFIELGNNLILSGSTANGNEIIRRANYLKSL